MSPKWSDRPVGSGTASTLLVKFTCILIFLVTREPSCGRPDLTKAPACSEEGSS